MRPYETLVVLSNELGEGKQQLIERLQSVVQSGGGTVEASRDWGNRKLAYTVKRQQQGHYYLLEYQAEPDVVREVERTLRITDGVLRYLSVQQEHTGLPETRPAERRESGEVPLSELRDRRQEPAPEPAPEPAAAEETPVSTGETPAQTTPEAADSSSDQGAESERGANE